MNQLKLVSDLESKIKSKESDIEEATEEHRGLKAELSKKAEFLQQLHGTIEDLRRQEDSARAERIQMSDKFKGVAEGITQQIEESQKRDMELRAKVASDKHRLQIIRSETDVHVKEQEALKLERKLIRLDTQQTERSLEATLKQLGHLHERKESLTESMRTTRSEAHAAQGDFRDFQGVCRNQERLVVNSQRRIAEQKKEITDLQRECGVLTRAQSETAKEIAKATEAAEQERAEADKRIAELEKRVARAKNLLLEVRRRARQTE